MSDLISRENALDLCKAIENELQEDIIDAEKNPNAYSSDFIKGMSSRMDGVLDVAIEISSLPSADRPIGEWLIGDAWPHNVYCSNCYATFAQEGWSVWEDGRLPRNFCPNCGAKMKGENNESNNSTGYYINESDSY